MIDPAGMSLRDWADSTIFALSDAWSFGRLDDESYWQDWGLGLLRAYSSQNLPNPYEFTDWREWARRIYPLLKAAN